MIGGLDTPDTGEILINNKNLNSIPRRIYFRDEVGFLFQNFALMENRTVKQNLDIIEPKNRTNITIREALKNVSLSEMKNEMVYKLSGGEQQRVALARLMIKKCNIILADEPTGSLDEKNGRIVMEQLHKLNEAGKSIIMVTHNREYLSEADMVVEL
jgi:putative ABC transport system ATP-binding protein